MQKRIIIMGASSGMGRRVAEEFIAQGYIVGLAARREERLQELQKLAKDRVFIQKIDITQDNAPQQLQELITKTEGMDIYFHAAGVGWENKSLNIEKELTTMQTNAVGFVRMIVTVYNCFLKQL